MAVRIGDGEADAAAAQSVHVSGQQATSTSSIRGRSRLRHRHVFVSGVLRGYDEKQEIVGDARLQEVRRFASRRLGRELAERHTRLRHRSTSASQTQTTTTDRCSRRPDRSVRSHAQVPFVGRFHAQSSCRATRHQQIVPSEKQFTSHFATTSQPITIDTSQITRQITDCNKQQHQQWR